MRFEFILLLLALVLVLLKVGWALFIIVISAALGATMDNHSLASGKEADDHAIHKFMKDVERRCERHTKSCLWWGNS